MFDVRFNDREMVFDWVPVAGKDRTMTDRDGFFGQAILGEVSSEVSLAEVSRETLI